MSPALVILIIDGALAGAAAWLWERGREGVAFWALASLCGIVLAQIVLFSCKPSANRTLKVQPGLRRAHFIQMPLQATVYVYWGLYWSDVGRHVPFLAAQLALAFALDSLLSWWRRGVWQAGFGPVPVVLSTNLFLWSQDATAYLQFSLIIVAYLGKEFITWERDGRRRHIFNPSAFPLTLVSLYLLASGSKALTRGVDIVGSFDLPPSFYEVVFLTGLVVQLVFLTTWISFGAVGTLCVLYYAALVFFDIRLGPTPFDPSVFLGATLLVTDPATSPASRPGKFLFGISYGLLVFVLCIVLRLLGMPSYFDKILPVPMVNLMVPWLERLGRRIEAAWSEALWLRVFQHRLIPVALYATTFVAMLPRLKQPVFGGYNPLPPPAINFSDPVSRQLLASNVCRTEFPEVYRPFAFASEVRRYPMIRSFLERAAGDRPNGTSQAAAR